MGEIFQALLWQWGIRNAPISVSNPIKPMQFVRGSIKLWVILYKLTLIYTTNSSPQELESVMETLDN